MRVQFDATHPAHVHLFKHAIRELAREGHSVCVTSRDKELTADLLEAYGIAHTPLSKQASSPLGLALEWAARDARALRFARKFDPDVVVSRLNPPAAHGAWLTGATSIVFHDSEAADKVAKATLPFTDIFCTPKGYGEDYGDKHVRYDGFHELAYLHPNWFEPDRELLREYGVDPDEPYFVLRFVSMDAHHDVGHAGFSPSAKRELIDRLSEHGRVYVSVEGESEPWLEPYEIPVPPARIHDLLSEAAVFVTDSDTMATEAAILGTPNVRLDTFGGEFEFGNFVELADYDLVTSTTDEDAAIEEAVALASDPSASDRWRERRDRLLEEKIDVTGFMLELIRDAAGESDGPEAAAD